MLDVCLAGTGGMKPLPGRWLTCLYARSEGHSVLIDCGEGTQIALAEAGCNLKPIDLICITHVHADHVAGLPGLLLSMNNCERTEPLTICGPAGLYRILQGLMVIAPDLSFDVMLSEISGETEQFLSAGPMRITPFPVKHRIPCLGYSVYVGRSGRFDPQKARELKIPVKIWSHLQNGSSIEIGQRIITPEMVMGPPRHGIRVVYATDTRPTESIRDYGRGADLMVLEGIYPDNAKLDKAKEWGHMTFPEAAALAASCGAGELWLTHYSPSLTDPEAQIENARCVFPNSIAGHCGMKKSLRFPDDPAK